MVQEVGHIDVIDYQENGTYIQAHVPEFVANKLKSFTVNEETDSEEEEDNNSIDWVKIGRG